MCLDIIDTSRHRRVEEQSIGSYKRTTCGALLPPWQASNCFPLSFLGIVIPTSAWFMVMEGVSIDTHLFCVITCTLSLYFLLSAWLTEPGILPTVDTEEARSDGRLVKKVLLNNRKFPLLQFRAKYCKELKVTIERFDHFCPWTGNGVGIRNYHLFFYFLVFTNVHAIFVGVTSLQASASNTTFRTFLVILTVYCIAIVCLVGFLLVYHIFLINQNITTNEKLKSTYGRQGQNPHNKGCFANWTTFFNNSFSVRKSYVIQSSRNTFYRLKVDDPSGVKEEETNDLLGDDSNARLSATV